VGGACVPAASTTDAGGASDAFAQSDSGGSGGTDAGTFVPVNAQSCAGGPPCNGVSCCTSIDVPGGTFPQGRSTVVGASDYYPDPNGYWSEETPEFPSTVSSFALDEYAVTVGRFRKFVEAYVSNTASAPAAGAGANPNVPGAGWQSEWNTNLPASQAAFKDLAHLNSCGGAPYYQTWTDNVGANENKPINCVSWYEAFAFCIWDGGRLPTESEWEYAAAGGEENRLYPWGSATPDCTYVNYCSGGNVPVANVGSTPNGNGRWGHADLAGNGMEWTLDWYDIYPNSPVTNYAAISNGHAIASSFARSVRAGDFRAAFRDGYTPDSRYAVSMRCARATQ
jgi:sulfatase modifying factor 1